MTVLHCKTLFLSTLSLRRATWANFSGFYWWIISIHALLAESDWADTDYNLSDIISIHALLAESDSSIDDLEPSNTHFYPRSPCGERRRRTYQQGEEQAFLSTLSLRRATVKLFRQNYECFISIHALLAESDWDKNGCGKSWRFLSTLSLRRATTDMRQRLTEL